MSKQMLTGSFQLMKSLNRSAILNIIREQGPISRADIAKLTKLTPPTVSNLVKELLDTGIIIETYQGESSGGRKPTMLDINSERFYVIGLDIGSYQIKAVLANLNGFIVKKASFSIPTPINNDRLLSLMIQAVHHMKEGIDDTESRMIGIGVGMHGIIDVDNGESLFAPNLNLYNIPIQKTLEKEFDILIKVENDVRAMALGERWFGNGHGTDSLVCINIGRGIGAGIIMDGKLFHGHNFISGEIGHMTIDIDGPKCSCGNYGCLQTLASGPAIARKAKTEIGLGHPSILTQLVGGDLGNITGETVYEAAAQGDPLSVSILSQAGRYIGIGLTNIIHLINPKRIIIGGGVSNAGSLILESIQDTIYQRALTASAKQTEIMLSKLGEDATALGAVTLILEELFATTSNA
ncbi:ROK family transcriptional regulator [Anoxybacteroides tepidamans]|uniref:ROK family transcriptional regulator n=1 Tax=Anoxybacteroides tepidamans TaxID=265948 RepID=UPI0004891DBB|nr:ROK family transcriptional regulator [Anoxybacillus tepidamans]